MAALGNIWRFLVVNRRAFLWSLGASVVGFMPLFGAPGMLFITIFDLITTFVTKKPVYDLGEEAWGLGIFYSIFWPWLAFWLYIAAKKFLPNNVRFIRTLVGVATFVLLFIGHTYVMVPSYQDRSPGPFSAEQSITE